MENIQANRIQARSFELVDESGNIRAQLACENEIVAMDFFELDNTPRISVGLNRTGAAGMALFDGQGKIRMRVSVEEDSSGATILNFRDAQDRIRAELLLESSGNIGLAMTDEWGHSRMITKVTPDGEASVAVSDEEGNWSGIANEKEG